MPARQAGGPLATCGVKASKVNPTLRVEYVKKSSAKQNNNE